jgi:transposase
MSKTFRAWNQNQEHLLPRSLKEYVPAEHPAHFIVKLVSEELNMNVILSSYKELRGYPPHSPKMMTAVLLYGYMRGVYSSRKLSEACQERTDFMVVSGMNTPDHRPIAMFRRKHGEALSELFVQVLKLCKQAKLFNLNHVAVDGTKIKGNASLTQNTSYAQLIDDEKSIAQEWIEKAEQIDREEDELFGEDNRGTEFPTAEEALRRIREAKKQLEEQDKKEREDRQKAEEKGTKPKSKTKKRCAPPPDKQYNFSDPDSGIMRTAKGYVQGYNAQVAVDTKTHIIVACGVSRAKNDLNELIPILKQIPRNCKKQAREISADSGYCTHENLKALKRHKVRGYLPKTDKMANVGIVRDMSLRLKRAGKRSRYHLRKITAEPVFGIIKSARGFGQFLLRGIKNVSIEWFLACTAHNLWKLAAARSV